LTLHKTAMTASHIKTSPAAMPIVTFHTTASSRFNAGQ
jgi:hypothetical protein